MDPPIERARLSDGQFTIVQQTPEPIMNWLKTDIIIKYSQKRLVKIYKHITKTAIGFNTLSLF